MVVGLVLVMASAMLLSGCGSSNEQAAPAGDELTKVTLGFDSWIGYGPMYIAQDKGFFEKYGIDIDIKTIEDSTQYTTLMKSGKLDALANVADRDLIYYQKGLPGNLILGLDDSYGADGLVVSPEIKQVSDLKGKTIALNKNASSYYFFLSILDKYGLKEEDVTIKDMGAGDAGKAFISEKVDAAITWEPWLGKAKEREGGQVLVYSDELPGVIVDVVLMRDELVKENPELAQGVVNAWMDAVAFYKDNVEEGNQIMADGFGYELADVTEGAKGVRFYGVEENKQFMSKDSDISIFKMLEKAQGYWLERGLMDEEVNLDEFINPQFVENAGK